MMAIECVVRDGAGNLERDAATVEGQTLRIEAGEKQDISFNLCPADVRGQSRVADGVAIQLRSGQQIEISNFFQEAKLANRLFISANGCLNELRFPSPQDEAPDVPFGPTRILGSMPELDTLYHLGRSALAEVDDAPATEPEATLDEVPLQDVEPVSGIDLGGQVEAGSVVVVTFDGVDLTADVDGAGHWEVTIPSTAIKPGAYDAALMVTAMDRAGAIETLSDTLSIDTSAASGPVVSALLAAEAMAPPVPEPVQISPETYEASRLYPARS